MKRSHPWMIANGYIRSILHEKKVVSTLEASLILPISKALGFFVDGTYSKHLSDVYLIGAIIKPLTLLRRHKKYLLSTNVRPAARVNEAGNNIRHFAKSGL